MEADRSGRQPFSAPRRSEHKKFNIEIWKMGETLNRSLCSTNRRVIFASYATDTKTETLITFHINQ